MWGQHDAKTRIADAVVAQEMAKKVRRVCSSQLSQHRPALLARRASESAALTILSRLYSFPHAQCRASDVLLAMLLIVMSPMHYVRLLESTCASTDFYFAPACDAFVSTAPCAAGRFHLLAFVMTRLPTVLSCVVMAERWIVAQHAAHLVWFLMAAFSPRYGATMRSWCYFSVSVMRTVFVAVTMAAVRDPAACTYLLQVSAHGSQCWQPSHGLGS